MIKRTFDRVPRFDERNRAFPAVTGLEDKTPRSYTWSCEVYNDQGTEGACVGFGWSHELAARPVKFNTDNALARKIYNRAKQLDPWAGEDYEGTSVLAGAKATQELLNDRGQSLMAQYRWAFGINDLILTVGYRGPVVLGVDWFEGMYDTDDNGFIHLDGNMVGGHALLANGIKVVFNDDNKNLNNINYDKSYFKLHNSWGADWGVNGACKLSFTDMNELFSRNGEACIPVIRKK